MTKTNRENVYMIKITINLHERIAKAYHPFEGKPIYVN